MRFFKQRCMALFLAVLLAFPGQSLGVLAAEETDRSVAAEEAELLEEEGGDGEAFVETPAPEDITAESPTEEMMPAPEDALAENLVEEEVSASEDVGAENPAEAPTPEDAAGEDLTEEVIPAEEDIIAESIEEEEAFSDQGAEEEVVLEEWIEEVPELVYPTGLADPEVLLEDYFMRAALPAQEAAPRLRKAPRADNLNEFSRGLYNYLKREIEAIAAGEKDSTSFEIPISDIYSNPRLTAADLGLDTLVDAENMLTEEAKAAFRSYIGFPNGQGVIRALMSDLPFDFYWFDKTTGYLPGVLSYTIAKQRVDGEMTIFFSSTSKVTSIVFCAAEAYRDPSESITVQETTIYTKTDKTKTGAASQSANRAGAVADAAASYSTDYERLAYFKNWINAATAYNYPAAQNSATPYGDPWQLIYVFDDDPDTKVVCEGYSKAFKFLVDLALQKNSFHFSDLDCFLVTGGMGTSESALGNHMWNVVYMDDGRYYLVDVTNCDNETYPDLDDRRLFLAGYDTWNSRPSGIFSIVKPDLPIPGTNAYYPSSTIYYRYDNNTLELFSETELSISAQDYDPGHVGGYLRLTLDYNLAEEGLQTEETGMLFQPGDVYGSILPTPEVYGYTFLGWFSAPTGGVQVDADTPLVTENDHTLYGRWEKKQYTVTFDARGGSPVGAQTVSYKAYAEEPKDPEREHYVFAGWYTDPAATRAFSFTTAVTRDLILYAGWTPASYAITFETDGGSAVEGQQVRYLENVSRPADPSWESFRFTGWYTDPETTELYDFASPVEGPLTLYAGWDPIYFEVDFDTEGGTPVEAQRVRYGETISLPQTPVLESYGFTGWYTDADRTQLYDVDAPVYEDFTLYAGWDAIYFAAVLKNMDGVATRQRIRYGQPATRPEDPTYEGFLFAGWFEEGTLDTPYDFDTPLYDDLLLYAKYAVQAPTSDLEDGVTLLPEHEIALQTDSPGVEIWYSVAGGEPTLYDGPFTLAGYEEAGAIQLRAWAVREGFFDSEEWERTVFLDDTPEGLWVIGLQDEVTFTGRPITFPNLQVHFGREQLTEGKDYTVKYADNTKVTAKGATLTITGKGNYAQTLKRTFWIRPLSLGGEIYGPDGRVEGRSNDERLVVEDMALPASGKLQKPAPQLSYRFGDAAVKLKAGTDYTVIYPGTNKKEADYDATAFTAPGSYTVFLQGKGNYIGTATCTVTLEAPEVARIPLSKLKVGKIGETLITGYDEEGTFFVKPSVVLKDGAEEIVPVSVEEEGDVHVSYVNNHGVGTVTIVLTADAESARYSGSRRLTYNYKGVKADKSWVDWVSDTAVIYSGQPVTGGNESGGAKPYRINYTAHDSENVPHALQEGKDYTVTWTANVNAGRNKATATFAFANGLTGSVKKTFTIEPQALTDAGAMHWEIVARDAERVETPQVQPAAKGDGVWEGTIVQSMPYTKGGAKPAISLTLFPESDHPIVLKEGVDYTVTYRNHTKVTVDENGDRVAGAAQPEMLVKGKGNFAGTLRFFYEVSEAGAWEERVSLTATDIVWKDKPGLCKPKLALYDADGKKLSAGKDYDAKTVRYTYWELPLDQEGQPAVIWDQDPKTKARIDSGKTEGDEVDLQRDVIPMGAVIAVQVAPLGNYGGAPVSTTFRFVEKDIAKAKVTISPQIYTGKPVTLSEEQLTVVLDKTELPATEEGASQDGYYIVPDSYENNVNKGTAKVTLRGTGSVGGSKTVTFKIGQKALKWEEIIWRLIRW